MISHPKNIKGKVEKAEMGKAWLRNVLTVELLILGVFHKQISREDSFKYMLMYATRSALMGFNRD